MKRRQFLQASAAGFAFAPAVLRRNYVYAEEFAQFERAERTGSARRRRR